MHTGCQLSLRVCVLLISDPEAVSVLCLPILQADGELVAVVELTRGKDRRPFTPEEEEVSRQSHD